MNEDISDNADISGSKISPASATNPGVVTINAQTFNGLKTFADRVVIQGNYSSAGTDYVALNNPLPIVCQYSNLDSNNRFGLLDVFVRNTNVANPTNLILIMISVDTTSNKEVSSYYEITLIGKQPITAIAAQGELSAADPVTYTSRLLLTVTGIEVTTTLLGRTHNTEPFVSTRIVPGFAAPSNFIIAVGFRNFSAYHVKGLRAGAPPNVFFITHSNAITNQTGANALLNSLTFNN